MVMAAIQQQSNHLDVADFTETVDVEYHNVPYILTISTLANDTLCLAVEQKSDASHWKGEFTARYIEDITAKTGSYKKFPVFVKMLLSAVKQRSDSVFVDLLTYQDLELLKNRKARGQAQPFKPSPPNNKRYLILTYAAEFDRVHYPLPLQFDENPDPDYLKGIIRRLRAEVDSLRTNPLKKSHEAELKRLRDENSALKEEVKAYQQQAMTNSSLEVHDLLNELQMAQKDRDLLKSRIGGYEAELARERGQHRRELRRANKEQQEAQFEVQKLREQIHELRFKCKELTNELEACNKRMSQERLRSTYNPYGRDARRPGRSSSVGEGSRASSRGASPTTSRAPSPTASTASGRTSSDRRRPGSAPAQGRFNPTEYVRQKKERERQLAVARGRAPTPPRSIASSGASTPTSSRPSSAQRGRSNGYTPRGRTSEDSLQDAGRARRLSGSGLGTSTSASSVPGAAMEKRPYSKFPTAHDARVERATSPGRALQDIKQKLSDYAARQGTTSTGGDDTPLRKPDSNGQQLKANPSAYDDPSEEIADIDSRLHALQNFLKMAKSAAP